MRGTGLSSAIAGLLAGSVGVIIGHPLDVIKTKMQIRDRWGSMNQKPPYSGAWNCAVILYKQQGLKGFYR